MLSRKISLLFIILLLSSCVKKDTNYLHHNISPLLQQDNRFYPLSLLQVNNAIDVVLVVDNSGSMQSIQNNVIRNAKLFFQQFAKEAYVDWKVGIVSTDRNEEPYLGFDSSFDASLIDPDDATSFDRVISQFQTAIRKLGTNGDHNEYTFYNLKRMLDRYGSSSAIPFQRTNAHLVTIMISDEKEQSKQGFGNTFEAINFFNTMTGYISPSKKLRFYGAIKHKELKDCATWGSAEPWKNSEFEKIISASEGFVVSACVDDFGNELAKIGKDIASLVGLPSLLLRRRPKVKTLNVYYEEELLAPGDQDDGGVWFYEEITNTINFYNLDFVQDLNNDRFRIEFEVDDGINRD